MTGSHVGGFVPQNFDDVIMPGNNVCGQSPGRSTRHHNKLSRAIGIAKDRDFLQFQPRIDFIQHEVECIAKSIACIQIQIQWSSTGCCESVVVAVTLRIDAERIICGPRIYTQSAIKEAFSRGLHMLHRQFT